MTRLSTLLVFSCFALPMAAGDGSVSGMSSPDAELLFRPGSQKIMAVLGSPGAAVLSEKTAFPGAVVAAAVSGAGRYVLGVASGNAGASVYRLSGETLGTLPDSDNADAVAVSPSGSTAVIYSSGNSRIEAFRGMPDNPVLAWQWEISGGTASMLAVGDDASVALIGTSQGLLAVTSAGPRPAPGPAAHAAAAVFLPGKTAALVAYDDANLVALLNDPGNTAEWSAVADNRAGLSRPVGLAIADRGRLAIAANAGATSITLLDTASWTAESVGVDCAVTALSAVSRPGRLALTGDCGVSLFDIPSRQSWFVPPAPAALSAEVHE